MKYLLSNIMAYDDSLSDAIEALSQFSNDELQQLSNEVMARLFLHENHTDWSSTSLETLGFLKRIDAEIDRLLGKTKQTNTIELNRYNAIVKREKTTLTMKRFEQQYCSSDDWSLMLEIDGGHRYWYNTQSLEIVVYFKAEITRYQADNKLRFWLQVTETQLEFNSAEKEAVYAVC